MTSDVAKVMEIAKRAIEKDIGQHKQTLAAAGIQLQPPSSSSLSPLGGGGGGGGAPAEAKTPTMVQILNRERVIKSRALNQNVNDAKARSRRDVL
jgi:hypothetical protein